MSRQGDKKIKDKNEPLVKRRGWLKNGNPQGDFLAAKRCGAKTRRGTRCKQPAMKNGRCRLHGGKSTGPKTQRGKQISSQNSTKHGYYSRENRLYRRLLKEQLRDYQNLVNSLK